MLSDVEVRVSVATRKVVVVTRVVVVVATHVVRPSSLQPHVVQTTATLGLNRDLLVAAGRVTTVDGVDVITTGGCNVMVFANVVVLTRVGLGP